MVALKPQFSMFRREDMYGKGADAAVLDFSESKVAESGASGRNGQERREKLLTNRKERRSRKKKGYMGYEDFI